MTEQPDLTRKLGDPIPRRVYAYLHPDFGEDLVRVLVLIDALLHDEDQSPRAENAIQGVVDEWSEEHLVVGPRTKRVCKAFNKNDLLSENEALIPVLLRYICHMASQDVPVDASAFRLGLLANDPTLLTRPTSRPGKAHYARNLKAKKKAGLEALDIVSLFRIAEVWVRVRHKLVPSLTDFVHGLEPRPYDRSDIDEAGPEFRNQYDVWRKELRRFDKALMAKTYT